MTNLHIPGLSGYFACGEENDYVFKIRTIGRDTTEEDYCETCVAVIKWISENGDRIRMLRESAPPLTTEMLRVSFNHHLRHWLVTMTAREGGTLP